LESLAPLNPEGQQRWREVCEGIERFIRASGLETVEDRAATEPLSEAKGSDAEPLYGLNRMNKDDASGRVSGGDVAS
jgi:hypothetical protein